MNIYIAMPNTAVTETFITPRSLRRLRKLGNVDRNMSDKQLTADEMVRNAASADVIFCGWDTIKFTKELVDRLPRLKVIAYVAGSMAPVVDEDTFDGGVVALTGNYIFARSVAEACLCYTLCALRRIEKYTGLVRSGGWRTKEFDNRGLFGKRVGLVGFGAIAKNFVELLKPFDVEIMVNAEHLTDDDAARYNVSLASREEVFSQCDVVSIQLALNEETYGCIDRRLLGLLKKDAVFLNTARGEIVDQNALEELLEEKRFWAALDVYSPEPLPEDSRLRTLENTVLIPHMGGPTIDMREYIVLSFARDLEAFERNEPMKNLFDVDTLKYMNRYVVKK